MACPSRIVAPAKPIKPCRGMPWTMRLEDHASIDGQLGAVYQSTRLDHEMRLDINSRPKRAKLTSIMVTLGIGNSHPAGIVDIIMAGANMLRLNVSHGDEKWHAITVQSIREAGNRIYESTREIQSPGVAVDLCGPEIRTGIFRGDEYSIGYATLEAGNTVRLMTDEIMKRAGCAACFWISHPEFPRICRPGDRIIIDRGAVVLRAVCIGETFVVCRIHKGGIVRDNKPVQLIDSAVLLPQYSEQDEKDTSLALKLECDFVIVSHARNAGMVYAVKNRAKQIGVNPIAVLAKISTQQGLENFDEILQAADGILLDGDGVEVDVKVEKLFLVQKFVVAKCIRIGKPIAVSFRPVDGVKSKIDMNLIASAVLNGVDAIFLATGGLNALETTELVTNVDLVCREAESARWQRQIFEELSYKTRIPLDPCHSVAVGAVETSLKSNAAAIIVTTTTGRSAVLLSIYRPRCPILAITRYGIVARWLQLYHAIYPLHYRAQPLTDWAKDMEERVQSGIDYLRRKKYIEVGDAVVTVGGWRQGTGFTNCIRVIYVSPGYIKNQTPDFEDCWS